MQAKERISNGCRKIKRTLKKYETPIIFAGITGASIAASAYLISKGFPEYFEEFQNCWGTLTELTCTNCRDYASHIPMTLENLKMGANISADYLDQAIQQGLDFQGKEYMVDHLREIGTMNDPEQIRQELMISSSYINDVHNTESVKSILYLMPGISIGVLGGIGGLIKTVASYRDVKEKENERHPHHCLKIQ